LAKKNFVENINLANFIWNGGLGMTPENHNTF